MIGRGFSNIPDVTKNLLILNVIMFVATFLLQTQGVHLSGILGMFYFQSEQFEPYQVVTHIFMHGGMFHIFFNMFALWIFGSALEQVWGPKRFLIFYFVCALGAAFLHGLVIYIQVQDIMNQLTVDQISRVQREGWDAIRSGENYINPAMAELNRLINVPVVGASGAVYGLLLGFGMLFPNTELMLMFIPVPIKAKFLVIGLGLLALWNGISNQPGDNIAHFAHLGGMLFGFIMIKLWQKSRRDFY